MDRSGRNVLLWTRNEVSRVQVFMQTCMHDREWLCFIIIIIFFFMLRPCKLLWRTSIKIQAGKCAVSCDRSRICFARYYLIKWTISLLRMDAPVHTSKEKRYEEVIHFMRKWYKRRVLPDGYQEKYFVPSSIDLSASLSFYMQQKTNMIDRIH